MKPEKRKEIKQAYEKAKHGKQAVKYLGLQSTGRDDDESTTGSYRVTGNAGTP